jgi:hypothetical protein
MNPYEVRLDEMAAQECLLNAAHRCGCLQARLRRTPVSRNPRLLQFVGEGSTPITPFHVTVQTFGRSRCCLPGVIQVGDVRFSLNAKSLHRLT